MEMASLIVTEVGGSINGTSLALFRIPFVFSQDELLTSAEFIEQSFDRASPVTHSDLQRFYELNLLRPLFRVGDETMISNRVETLDDFPFRSKVHVFNDVRSGKVSDCQNEVFNNEFPFVRPPDEVRRNWWNGYLYSSWQLLGLPRAIHLMEICDRQFQDGIHLPQEDRLRKSHIAMSALASVYLPGIMGTISLPDISNESPMYNFLDDVEVKELLDVAEFSPVDLAPMAEQLLADAHMKDPMIGWWPIIRHSNYLGWKKIKGRSLGCLWQRIAAEMFLRAHEDLAKLGYLDPLPDISHLNSWHAFQDRVTPSRASQKALEEELASFGISPHARVLLLVEGETESLHMNHLLSLIGLNDRNKVRIQIAGGSKTSAKLLSQFAIAPKPSRIFGEHRFMLPPTALIIAMDPENGWESPKEVKKKIERIRTAIYEELKRDNAAITEREFDFLVTTFVWPNGTYELSNFSDDELFGAIRQLTMTRNPEFEPSESWSADIIEAIRAARIEHCDLSKKLGPLKASFDKIEIAKLLVPVLAKKIDEPRGEDLPIIPVFQLLELVQNVYGKFYSGLFTFENPVSGPDGSKTEETRA